MLKRYIKQVLLLLVILLTVGQIVTIPVSFAKERYSEIETGLLLEYIEDIINWKKDSMDTDVEKPLLNNTFLENAGDTTGDWYPIGLGRIGYPDDYDAYLAVISEIVSQRYQEENQLSDSKATEWHRISLAILAMGGDPTQIGQDRNEQPINLIADGTYNRGKVKTLGAQGLNGWIWGLIALDSMRYKIPKDAYYTRNDIIMEILRQQMPDGGFSLHTDKSDPDMTAMALQALAPYYNSEKIYEYELKATNEIVSKTVRQVVDEALVLLENMQLDDGDYDSWETENAESTAQVIVALTALGIDPLRDERFIKNGHTLLDGIMKYQVADGGFMHSEKYDSDNPTSMPNESNTMASEQVLYSFVALVRFYEDYRSLYDFREEMDSELKKQIKSVKEEIANLPEHVSGKDTERIKQVFAEYLDIPVSERSYVFNYDKLAALMEEVGVKNTSDAIADYIGVTDKGNGAVTSLFNEKIEFSSQTIFTDEDEAKVIGIPEKLTTEHYVEVVKLLEKLKRAENYKDYEYLVEELSDKKTKIEAIEAEIVSLNNEILEKLYPFHHLSIKDKQYVDEIITRYEKLSDYDKEKIVSYQDVEKSKTQIDNLVRERYITGVVAVIAVIVVISIIWRRKKRKEEKLKQNMVVMDEKE